MKKYLLSVYSIACISVSAQETIDRQMYTMVEHPVCNQVKGNDALLNCFQELLLKRFTKQVENYMDRFEYFQLEDASAKVEFVIDKNGLLKPNKITSSNSIYKEYVEKAFHQVIHEINTDKNQRLIPAKKGVDHTPIAIGLSFPVSFKINPNLYTSEKEDRVIVQLKDANFFFEIIFTPEKEFKVYEIHDEKNPIYLGKYNSIDELASVEPFHTMLEQLTEDTMLLGEGEIKGKVYQVYSTNWRMDSDQPFFIQVVQKKQGKNKRYKQVALFSSFVAFNSSKYFGLVKRNY